MATVRHPDTYTCDICGAEFDEKRQISVPVLWLTEQNEGRPVKPYFGECAVYPARPESCRAYRCDRHVRGELRGYFGASSAKVVDMREIAERWRDE